MLDMWIEVLVNASSQEEFDIELQGANNLFGEADLMMLAKLDSSSPKLFVGG